MPAPVMMHFSFGVAGRRGGGGEEEEGQEEVA